VVQDELLRAACRIPLVIARPGRFAPRRSAALVSLLDVLPTLRELGETAGAASDAVPVDGRSLVPELSGRDAPGEVIGEYLAEAAIAPLLMIRRGRYKFIHHRPIRTSSTILSPTRRSGAIWRATRRMSPHWRVSGRDREALVAA